MSTLPATRAALGDGTAGAATESTDPSQTSVVATIDGGPPLAAESAAPAASVTATTASAPPPTTDGLSSQSSDTSAKTDGVDANLPAPGADGQVESHFWLRHGDQLFLGVLVAAALILCGVHWVRLSRWGTQPVEIQHLESSFDEYRIDINRATWVEWVQLDGIGETLARRIVEDREQHGPFRSIDDLQRVKGIGPKTIERIRHWLTCEPAESQESPQSGNAGDESIH